MEDLPPTLTLFSPFITASPVDSRSSPCRHFLKRISLSLPMLQHLQNISMDIFSFSTEFSPVLN